MSSLLEYMDLKRQYHTMRDEILEAVDAVCEDTAFCGGFYVERLEKEFAAYQGANYAAGLSNGTDALYLACRALDLSEGDEVIVPANTFIASAWAPAYTGAKVVFCDCRNDTWEIDPKHAESLVTPHTRAVIGVHLYGQPFDVDAIRKITDSHGLYLIEDCAQAHGAAYKGRMVGSLGHIGCFSFYPSKNLGAYGEAGLALSNDEALIRHIRSMRSHGEFERYHHDELGFNMRMDGIQANILRVKLRHLPVWTQRRRDIAEIYTARICNPAITLQALAEGCEPVYYLYCVLVDDRARFMAYTEENGVKCGMHYPVPCHLQKAFASLGYHAGDLPNAEYQAAHCVSLPLFPELTDAEVDRVVEICNRYRA